VPERPKGAVCKTAGSAYGGSNPPAPISRSPYDAEALERFDAIVIGAGPAGSVTAVHLARAGARVLVVDRARFPRDKPCGGGLTMRAVRELPVSVDAVVEHVVDRIGFRLAYGMRFERFGRGPLIEMTQRIRLDQHLLEHAADAGADVRDGVKVTDVEVGETGVSLRVDGRRVEGQVLVGADGVNGRVRQGLGLGSDYVLAVALEGNVPLEAVGETRYRGRAVLELGTIPGGYGWVFPKGDHVNVGVGGWLSEGPKLRDHLKRLCVEHRIDDADVSELRGHRLPLRRAGAHPVAGRVLVVGDAAGLVDPLTGDGMFEAFVSSRLAAGATLDLLGGRADSLEPYAVALTRALAPHASASWGAKIALDRFPRLVFGIARIPPVWRVVESLIRGDMSHPNAARGAARAPLRMIEALARTAGDPGRGYRAEAAA
jgi:geranylgeranyl reductase family protein